MLINSIVWILCLFIGIVIALIARALSRDSGRYWYEMLVSILGAFIGAFFVSQFGFVGITDFHPWSILAAPIGSIALISLFRRFGYQEPYRLYRLDTPETPKNEADMDAYAEGETEFKNAKSETLRVVREPVYLHRDILVALILLLPMLDVFIFRFRIPDISDNPPPFGVVERYQSEQGSLDYLVYSPATSEETSAAELPLLLMLHGCTQDPYLLNTASGMKEMADENQFILLMPQQNASASPHRCWNWYQERNQNRDSGEPALLMGIVNQVRENYPVDDARIYVTGISSGGAMTSILASCYPDVFAAAAVHSGMGYKSSTNVIEAIIAPFLGSQTHPEVAGRQAYECAELLNRPIPVMILHGSADTVVFPENAQDTLETFAQMNDFQDEGQDNDSFQAIASNTQTEQVEGGYSYTIENYNVAEASLLQVYRVEGLGHMWSGGTGIYPLSDPKAPNASRIFWEFLSSHSLP